MSATSPAESPASRPRDEGDGQHVPPAHGPPTGGPPGLAGPPDADLASLALDQLQARYHDLTAEQERCKGRARAARDDALLVLTLHKTLADVGRLIGKKWQYVQAQSGRRREQLAQDPTAIRPQPVPASEREAVVAAALETYRQAEEELERLAQPDAPLLRARDRVVLEVYSRIPAPSVRKVGEVLGVSAYTAHHAMRRARAVD